MDKVLTLIKKNKLVLFIMLIIILLGFFIFLFLNKRSNSHSSEQTTNDELTLKDLQESEVIPTVDSSVKVSLTPNNYNREVVMEVKGIPINTGTIEYELSYFAKGDLPKGAIGNIDLEDEKDKTMIKREITLGTCSSGTCVYDEGVTSVKVTLKFNGDYGARLFEKEFEL